MKKLYRPYRPLFYLFYLLFMSVFPSVSYAETSLESLLLPFTKIASIHFSYTEIRTSLFFKKPQISTGEIQFIRPDRLIKKVISPHYQEFDIDKEHLTIRFLDKADKQLALNSYPQLKSFVWLIKAILSGDRHYLKQHYALTLTFKNDNSHFWQLTLMPKDFSDKSIKSINITGKDEQITAINMQGFAGERSELIIEKIL